MSACITKQKHLIPYHTWDFRYFTFIYLFINIFININMGLISQDQAQDILYNVTQIILLTVFPRISAWALI